jgi:N-acetyl-D-muramate 6-phosphate phosphatase
MTDSPAARVRTVLFDLDGTLADTAPDLAYALNTLLEEEAKTKLPFETIRPAASHGGIALIGLGFGLSPDDPAFNRLRQRFLDIYQQNIARETRIFDGMQAILDELENRQLNWGVVTNKPGFLTEPLMDQLAIREKAVCIISGDSTPNRKPHPEPLLYACTRAGSEPAQCLYVGDAERDIVAGHNAGMQTLVALYGYIAEEDDPAAWGADGMINHPKDILDWLDR